MISLDFFLYDNRTWSPRLGRDWGLKAATGALTERADLKADFNRYCGAMPGEQGQLSGFGEAIGGVRPAAGGYILCVTLETADFFGRPSWAVFGLWCPDSGTVEQVLSAGDPIGSARALLDAEAPPSKIEICPAKIAVRPRRRGWASTEALFFRFRQQSTVREVCSLLLGAAQSRATIPNVLGITATSRLAAVERAGFNVVYCHPMDERAERALARALSPQEPEIEEPEGPDEGPATSPHEPIAEPPVRQPVVRLVPLLPGKPTRTMPVKGVIVGLLLGIAIAVLIFFVASDIWRLASSTSHKSAQPAEEEGPVSTRGGSGSGNPVSEERPAEAVLDEVRERLEECKRLVPEDLRQSPGFLAAERIEVLPAHEAQRQRVRQAFAALIEIQGRMVKRQGNYVAYYFDESGKDASPAIKLKKITEILGEASLGSQDCSELKNAFGFEFESQGSVLRRWCDTLGRLEKTAGRNKPISPRRGTRSPTDKE
jgi:hypothetical protein